MRIPLTIRRRAPSRLERVKAAAAPRKVGAVAALLPLVLAVLRYVANRRSTTPDKEEPK